MIKYTEWKNNIHIAESSDEMDSAISSLIQKTTQEIVTSVQSYVAKNVAPERAAPPESPSPVAAQEPERPGPFQRLGGGIDKVGASAINKITPGIAKSDPVKISPEERGRLGIQPNAPVTAGKRLLNRNPVLNSLIHGSGKVDQKAPLWRKVWDRVKTAGGWMKKENRLLHPSAILSRADIQEMLISSGVKPFFLVEANEDFSGLTQTISDSLMKFANEVKNQLSKAATVTPSVPPSSDVPPDTSGTASLTPDEVVPTSKPERAARAARPPKEEPAKSEINTEGALDKAKKSLNSKTAKTPAAIRWLTSMGLKQRKIGDEKHFDIDEIKQAVTGLNLAGATPKMITIWSNYIYNNGTFSEPLRKKIVQLSEPKSEPEPRTKKKK